MPLINHKRRQFRFENQNYFVLVTAARTDEYKRFAWNGKPSKEYSAYDKQSY